MDQQAEKDKKERVTGLGRGTREEIAKWNQRTALRFQTGGDIRHPWPPFGGKHYRAVTELKKYRNIRNEITTTNAT